MRALAASICLTLMSFGAVAQAGPLRERLQERRAQQAAERGVEVAYGADPAQVFDVYHPASRPTRPQGAPVIVLVHGGAWRTGDKANGAVVDAKVRHWTGQGYLVVSTNYRLLPTPVTTQADDVALAIETVRRRAAEWGGDANRLALVGHSAGAHLIALLNSRAPAPGLPWRAVVALDSAAFDVETIMQGRHARLYDQAFGSDPALWRSVSPYAQLMSPGRPTLAVCSTQRDDACPQAERYAAKARPLGAQVEILPLDLSHREINAKLGAAPGYTAQVDRFLAAHL